MPIYFYFQQSNKKIDSTRFVCDFADSENCVERGLEEVHATLPSLFGTI